MRVTAWLCLREAKQLPTATCKPWHSVDTRNPAASSAASVPESDMGTHHKDTKAQREWESAGDSVCLEFLVSWRFNTGLGEC